MSRTIAGVTWAVALGAVVAGAQTPQQKPSTPSPQQQATGRSITVSGCVYQVTDQPTAFALRGMDEQGTTQSGTSATQSGTGATTGTAGRPGTAGTSGTSGTAGAGAGSTSSKPGAGMAGSGSEMQTDGAWYRLMDDAKLKEHVGQRVRITGSVTPGKDEKGADIVIHRIQPDKVTITSIDLKPAPQLRIQTISQIAGDCPTK